MVRLHAVQASRSRCSIDVVRAAAQDLLLGVEVLCRVAATDVRYKGRIEEVQVVPGDAVEEGVAFDFCPVSVRRVSTYAKDIRQHTLRIICIDVVVSSIGKPVRPRRDAHTRILQKPQNKVSSVRAHLLRRRMRKIELLVVVNNRSFGVVTVGPAKGRMTVQTFIQDDADAPLVAPAIVGSALDHLGCHVL